MHTTGHLDPSQEARGLSGHVEEELAGRYSISRMFVTLLYFGAKPPPPRPPPVVGVWGDVQERQVHVHFGLVAVGCAVMFSKDRSTTGFC